MDADREKNPAPNGATPAGAKQIPWPVARNQNDLFNAASGHDHNGRVYALQGKKVGEILHTLGVIDDKTLQAVGHHHNTKNIKSKPIGALLVHMGIIEAEALTRALCIQSGMPMVEVLSMHIPYETLDLIPYKEAKQKKVIPVGVFNKTLFLAVADPATFSDQHHFAFISKLKIRPVFTPLHEIELYINTKWKGGDSEVWAG